jgi:hypothetical protein
MVPGAQPLKVGDVLDTTAQILVIACQPATMAKSIGAKTSLLGRSTKASPVLPTAMGDRNDRIKEFYYRVWFGNKDVPFDTPTTATFSGSWAVMVFWPPLKVAVVGVSKGTSLLPNQTR